MEPVQPDRHHRAHEQGDKDGDVNLDVLGDVMVVGVLGRFGDAVRVFAHRFVTEDTGRGRGKSRPGRRSARTTPRSRRGWYNVPGLVSTSWHPAPRCRK